MLRTWAASRARLASSSALQSGFPVHEEELRVRVGQLEGYAVGGLEAEDVGRLDVHEQHAADGGGPQQLHELDRDLHPALRRAARSSALARSQCAVCIT